MMAEAVKYSDTITVSVLPGLRDLMQRAAVAAGMKSTDWHRKALDEALKARGFDPAELVRSRSASELYDVVESKRRYAMIDGDTIAHVVYRADDPRGDPEQAGRTWLPVFHVDSEPFDLSQHFRLKPVFSIDGDKVLCTYPVVSRSSEFA